MNDTSSMLLIGIGGGGCAIARGVRRAFGEDIRCPTLDTDAATGQSGDSFVLIGGERLSGRGAGGDVVAARLAAEDSVSAIDPEIEGQLATLFAKKPKLYWIGIGKTDFLYEGNEKMRNYFDSKGYPYEYVETSGGHIWANWRIYLTIFARKIFK